MYELIYVSDTDQFQNEDQLLELLTQARDKNKRLNITGLLIYHNKKFMQLLEGAEEDVKSLMEEIKNDSRHSNVQVLIENKIEQRSFKQWSMAFLDVNSEKMKNIEGFSDFLENGFYGTNGEEKDLIVMQRFILTLKEVFLDS